MIGRLLRVIIGMLMPLALAGCVLAPGKFVSKMTINADRSFTFSYVGEVMALDLGSEFGKGMGDAFSSDTPSGDTPEPSTDDGKGEELQPALWKIALQDSESKDDDADKKADAAAKKAAAEIKNKAIAEALSKEAGYRKVTYMGDGKFEVDYQISGTLTHSFVYPYNVDAEAVFPFIVVEVRANNTVRIKAPAFANESTSKGMPGADQASSKLDGVFTLDTDAEIVSQNNEDGAASAGGRKTVTWKATPLSKTAPMAVLRFK
ncbi:hypothetical protein G4G27_01570 [Sphingomonas sp. So64.6b]|uniref:hypothetical protein n=1 Tax=Sphingomonas sp. So64.6b TaxID=2997354 RepID=UPI001601F7E8|nr:hypothetical protein [Sphingomonas sp. So64.6b]QNA82845.1 hypothetical protein G4G27_01570 [Sphingomonas sp. So64.6b]